MHYLKLLHILFAFCWLGTLLALTRLMGKLAKEPELVQERCKKMFARLYFFVDLPSMIITVGTGITLLVLKDVSMKEIWLHLKLTCVLLLVIVDIWMGGYIAAQKVPMTHARAVQYKIFHSFVALLLIGVLFSIYVLKAKSLA